MKHAANLTRASGGKHLPSKKLSEGASQKAIPASSIEETRSEGNRNEAVEADQIPQQSVSVAVKHGAPLSAAARKSYGDAGTTAARAADGARASTAAIKKAKPNRSESQIVKPDRGTKRQGEKITFEASPERTARKRAGCTTHEDEVRKMCTKGWDLSQVVVSITIR